MTKFVNRQRRADEATEARLDPAVASAFNDHAARMEPVAKGGETGFDHDAHTADSQYPSDALGGLRRSRQRRTPGAMNRPKYTQGRT